MEYNGKLQFDNFLQNIIQPSKLTIPSTYVLPSEDLKLKEYAKTENVSYRSSTSSMSSILSLLFLQLSNHKPTNSYLMDSFKNFVKKLSNLFMLTSFLEYTFCTFNFKTFNDNFIFIFNE